MSSREYISFGLGSLILAAVMTRVATATTVVLDHYNCIPGSTCNSATTPCWGTGHPWGGGSCVLCNGSAGGSMCVRSQGGTCTTSSNVSCGVRTPGTCTGGPVGTCTATGLGAGVCSVPQC